MASPSSWRESGSRLMQTGSPSAQSISAPDESSASKQREASAFAHNAIKRHAATQERQRTARENPNFVADFLSASRLHFIGSWKARYEELLSVRPPPPPLPAVPPGGERAILHIDMDCFFASVAVRNRPALEGLPLAVSWSDNERGAAEIASANYRARDKGVRNGMWVANAKQLCPELLIMPYEFEAYASTAEDMYRCIFEVTPHVMGVSVDECYADVTGLGEPGALVTALRAAIARATGGCAASVGIGPNRLLARLATRHAKPNGQHAIGRDEAAARLSEEAVDALPGVGRDKRAKLLGLGIENCAQLVAAPAARLQRALGPRVAEQLRAFARGVDKRPWEPMALRRSVGAQASWGVRFEEDAEVEHFVRQLCDEVSGRMAQYRVRGRALTVQLWRAVKGAPASLSKGSMGHGLCDKLSRSSNLPSLTADATVLARQALQVVRLLAVPPGELRGMGVQVTRLDNQPGGGAPAGGSRRLLMPAPAPPASEFDPSTLPRWYHERPGVAKALAAAAQSAGARPDAEPTGRKRARAVEPLQAAAPLVRPSGAGPSADAADAVDDPESCSPQLGRALEAFTDALNEGFVEAVLRAEERQAPPEPWSDEESDEGRACSPGPAGEDAVFARLLPLLRTLAEDLRRIGGPFAATECAVAALAESARQIGMRCQPLQADDDARQPPEWTSGLARWLEACDALAPREPDAEQRILRDGTQW